MTATKLDLSPPRLERIKIENFRVLRNVKFKDLTPLSVLLGPNGSGKSTFFDVFAFLADCFGEGLRRAVDKRGRFRNLRSRDSQGPISFEIVYREAHARAQSDSGRITYHLRT